MDRAHQVLGGREVEGGVTVRVLAVEPVAAEDGELAVLGELLQAREHALEVGRGGAVGLAGLVGIGRRRVQSVQRVDVVKTGQVVEPQDRGVQNLTALGEVTDEARALRDLDAVGVLGGKGAGVRVAHRAHAADTLGDERGVVGAAALEGMLQATVQVARGPRLGDLAVLDFHLDGQMALDTGNGINGRTCHYSSPPFMASSFAAAGSSLACSTLKPSAALGSRPAFLASRMRRKRLMFLGSRPSASRPS